MRFSIPSWQRLSNGSRIRTTGPRAWAPPRLRIVDPQKYFPISHNVYVVGPDVQCNPALTATGCDALSFCTTRTRRQPVALG